jgi:RNA polymerase sigma-70 factor (ECF subfamily)
MSRVMDDMRRAKFDAVYSEFGAEVLAYALRRSSPELANDVLAETFLTAWRRVDAVPDEPLPWLLGVARRKLSNARRSSARFEALRDRLAREPAAASSAESSDAAALVLERLRHLPERYREALLLVAWEGLTDTQAARVLGCSPTAFRLRLHRARKRLLSDLRASQPEQPIGSPLFIERAETS